MTTFALHSNRPSAHLRLLRLFCVRLSSCALLCAGVLLLILIPRTAAYAQEAEIRKNLPAGLPSLPKISKVSPSPVSGVFEVILANNEVLYSDASGRYVLQGELLDVAQRLNLTQERLDQLSAVAFKDLPLKDAFTVVRGNGQRKLAVFADPNCGYCKRLESELQKIDNVTVYNFLYPILGPDSIAKAKNVWCAANRGKAWLDWMLRGVAVPAASDKCDTSVIDRTVAYGQSKRIQGTPAVFFQNGKRVPGAMSLTDIEQQLATQ